MTKELRILSFLKDNYSDEMLDLKPLIKELYPKVENGNIEDLKEVAGDVITLIHNLTKGNKLIDDDQSGLASLGGSSTMVVNTFEGVKIKAKITPAGIAHLSNLKTLSEDNLKIGHNLFVNGDGNIITQSSFDSSRNKRIEQVANPAAQPNKKKAIIAFIEKFWWNIVIALIIGVILIAIEYNFFKSD